MRIWVCVSKEFSEKQLLREIIEGAGVYAGKDHAREVLAYMLQFVIQDKKVLLVLDDVWTSEVWEDLLRDPLQGAAAGSKVLLTTRFESVGKCVGAAHLHAMQRMYWEEAWFLLRAKAFVNGESLEEMESLRDVGVRIVERCGHLPLAINAVGGVLRSRGKERKEWEEVLHSRTWSSTIFAEDMKDGVMQALHLSYEDLPPYLKQCFLYFSLFPEDHVFKKPSVVRQWIAEGFVESIEGESALMLEWRAQEYFSDLVTRNLLQPEFAAVEGAQCRMHDLLRSLARFLTEDENFFGPTANLGLALSKLRRLSVAADNDDATGIDVEAVKSKECLRTLFLLGNPQARLVLRDDVLGSLGNLRVLDLREAYIEELPLSITNLRHLRLLDVSGTAIRELPESIARLRSLQFLLLNNCSNIRALPDGVTELKRLRTLELCEGTEVDQMPKGIGSLTQLRTLQKFAVSGIERTLEELRPLSNLGGLAISKLERVADQGRASCAALDSKPLVYLSLESTLPASSDEETQRNIVDVLEGLCPPSSLEYLHIFGYMGNALPRWMWPSATYTAGVSPIQNLVVVALDECRSFAQLPPLGHLPHLKSLWINGAHAVTSVVFSFTATALFPMLDVLHLSDMPKLQEIGEDFEGNGSVKGWAAAFPRLSRLSLKDCPKLCRLPTCFSPRRKFVNIDECPALTEVGDLKAPQTLRVVDGRSESLPPWLAQVSVDPEDTVPFVLLKVRFFLLERMLCQREERPDDPESEWYAIKRFPSVYAEATDHKEGPAPWFSYTKNDPFFNTNLQIAPSSSVGNEEERK